MTGGINKMFKFLKAVDKKPLEANLFTAFNF
jgi:hypothetical protein